MATSTRESRRRKILERGSDRLAFIKGQVPNLPPPHSLHQTDIDPPPPSVPCDQDPPPNFSRQPASFSPVLLKHDPVLDADLSLAGADNVEIGEGSALQGGGTSVESAKDTTLNASGEANSLPVSLDDRSSFISTPGVVHHSQTQSKQRSFFNPKQISSSIDASEKTRLSISVIVAILVVLSHLRFPLLGSSLFGSIISFRPLYFILLTNVTLVITRLLFDDHGSSRKAIGEEHKAASPDDNNLAKQLSKTLELGFVAKKVIDAVFMDCSVYAVVVICGLSFT